LEGKWQEYVNKMAKVQQDAWFAQIKVFDLEHQANKKDNEIGHLREIE
jgi:hypothetical protein